EKFTILLEDFKAFKASSKVGKKDAYEEGVNKDEKELGKQLSILKASLFKKSRDMALSAA
ncbi:unnamed protein product, partial [Ilex paraguariensis]